MRRYAILCALLLWLAVAQPPALAAGGAEALASLGLLQGSEAGLETGRPLTRAEGTVLLLRFLGLEETALAQDAPCPFSDGGWAAPYLGYAADQGLVNGVGDGRFAPEEPLDRLQFSTLLLRGLGYREGTDFTYAQADQTLYSRLDYDLGEGALTRGEAGELLFRALWTPRGEGGDQARRLMEAGLLTEADCRAATRLASERTQPATTTVLFYIIASDLESVLGEATADLEAIAALPPAGEVQLLFQTGGTKDWKTEALTDGAVERSVLADGVLRVEERLPDAAMTQEQTLSQFIQWGVERAPADRYILVLWDHGFGTMGGFGRDETGGAAMTLAQLGQGVEEGGQWMDLIVFDACLMSTVETAWALRGSCDYLVASQTSIPAAGLHYPDWLTPLYAQPGMDSYQLAKLIATGFDMRRGSALGGGVSMAVLSPAWAGMTLSAWGEALAGEDADSLRTAAAECIELGLRDGGFDQFDLSQLAQALGKYDGSLAMYAGRLAPFRKNGPAMTGLGGVAVYLPYRHEAQYDAVRQILDDCGISETYLERYDAMGYSTPAGQEKGRTEQ